MSTILEHIEHLLTMLWSYKHQQCRIFADLINIYIIEKCLLILISILAVLLVS